MHRAPAEAAQFQKVHRDPGRGQQAEHYGRGWPSATPPSGARSGIRPIRTQPAPGPRSRWPAGRGRQPPRLPASPHLLPLARDSASIQQGALLPGEGPGPSKCPVCRFRQTVSRRGAAYSSGENRNNAGAKVPTELATKRAGSRHRAQINRDRGQAVPHAEQQCAGADALQNLPQFPV